MAPLKLSFRVSGMTRDVPSPAKQRGGGGLAVSSLAWSHPCLDVSRWGWSAGPRGLPSPQGIVFSPALLCHVCSHRREFAE